MSNLDKSIKRLKEYIKLDNHLHPASIKSDFDLFCEEHCQDIQNVLDCLENKNKTDFKIGDVVRINDCNVHQNCCNIGKLGVIIDIKEKGEYVICLNSTPGENWSKDELILDKDLENGDTVYHFIYGYGVIIKVDENGYIVRFIDKENDEDSCVYICKKHNLIPISRNYQYKNKGENYE